MLRHTLHVALKQVASSKLQLQLWLLSNGTFLKAYHHWSPPGAWAPSEDAQEIQDSHLQPHLLNKQYH